MRKLLIDYRITGIRGDLHKKMRNTLGHYVDVEMTYSWNSETEEIIIDFCQVKKEDEILAKFTYNCIPGISKKTAYIEVSDFAFLTEYSDMIWRVVCSLIESLKEM